MNTDAPITPTHSFYFNGGESNDEPDHTSIIKVLSENNVKFERIRYACGWIIYDVTSNNINATTVNSIFDRKFKTYAEYCTWV